MRDAPIGGSDSVISLHSPRPRFVPYVLLLLPVVGNGALQIILVGRLTGTVTFAALSICVGLLYCVYERHYTIMQVTKFRLSTPLLVYLGYFVVNTAFLGRGLSLEQHARRMATEILLPVVIYWVASYACIRDGANKVREWLIALMVAESLLSSFAVMALGGIQRIAELQESGTTAVRDYGEYALSGGASLIGLAAGTLIHPNLLGALLVILLPQLLISWRHDSARRARYTLALAIVGVGILLTFSRGGWIGCVITAVIALLFAEEVQNRWALAVVPVIIFVGIELIPPLWGRLLDQVTVGSRASLLTLGLQLFLQRPWFGYGLAFFVSVGDEVLLVNPHNDYLTRLMGGGVVGLVAFLVPFAYVLFFTLRVRRRVKDARIRFESAMAFATCFSFTVMMALNPIQEVFYLVVVAFAIFETQLNRAMYAHRQSGLL